MIILMSGILKMSHCGACFDSFIVFQFTLQLYLWLLCLSNGFFYRWNSFQIDLIICLWHTKSFLFLMSFLGKSTKAWYPFVLLRKNFRELIGNCHLVAFYTLWNVYSSIESDLSCGKCIIFCNTIETDEIF